MVQTLETPQKWSLQAVFALHQRARRALDRVSGLDEVLVDLRAAEAYLCGHFDSEADSSVKPSAWGVPEPGQSVGTWPVLLARTRTLIGSALGRQGRFAESREWLEKALSRIPESEPALRTTALNAYAVALRNLGDVAEAYRIFDELDQVARKSGTARDRVRLLTNKANLLQENGDSAGALPLRLVALKLSHLLHDGALRSRMLINLGFEQLELGDSTGAKESLAQADEELVETEDVLTVAHALMLRGRIALLEGRKEAAVAAFLEGLTLFRNEPGGTAEARLQLYAAEAHNQLGAFSEAEPLVAAASHFFGAAGHRRLWLECLLERSRIIWGQKDLDYAATLAADVRRAAERHGQLDIVHGALCLCADIAEAQGDVGRALARWREAERVRDRWYVERSARQLELIRARLASGKLADADESSEVSDRTEELEQKNRELERLHRDKQELITLIAHDLRNQLGATVNFSELALLTPDPQVEELRDQLQTIFSITRSTQELLEHLLSLERIESDEVPVVPEPLELRRWGISLLERSGNLGRMKSITARVESDAERVVLETDETWLRLATDNLLTNAFKYSPHGSEIILRIVQERDRTIVQVEDEGPGIPEADRVNLFTKFHRTRNQPTGSEFSTGLGLYLVRQYAQLLGCEAGYQPRPGGGSIFYLAFPRL